MLYPFVYVLAISLNDPNDSQLGGIWLYPRVLSLESYKIIFSDPSLLQALWISVSRTVLGTVLTVFGCSMFAYVYTRNEFVLYKPLKGFFFFAMFFLMLWNTYLVFAGAQNLSQVVTLLWTFRLPWHWAYHGTLFSPGVAQFAFGFYSVMLTSTLLGLVTMVLFKPRSWCVYCPMGTMTQLICQAKYREK